jgi:mannose-6-phosphate isomerase-like protein (cupin superfamily)
LEEEMTSPRHEHEPVLARAAEVETLSNATAALSLLVDSSSTGGALGCHRATLTDGADGALPHYHANSSEAFFVLDGKLQMLHGDSVVEAGPGDLLVLPPGMHHAFAAAKGSGVDVLITITPGVERFDYFRLLGRVVTGQAPYSDLLAAEAQFDSYSVQSVVWQKARS